MYSPSEALSGKQPVPCLFGLGVNSYKEPK